MSHLVKHLLNEELMRAEDNLNRAKSFLRGLTEEQLRTQFYGQSGHTCKAILDGYQMRYDEIKEEIRRQR